MNKVQSSQPQAVQAIQLGRTVDESQPFFLVSDSIYRHMMCFGVSGSGKSKGIADIVVQLINNRIAVSVIDPHSDLCTDILNALLSYGYYTRANPQAFSRVLYIRFADPKGRFVPFNWLRQPFPAEQIALHFLEVVKRTWPELGNSSVNMDNILLSATMLLLANDRPLTDLLRVLTNQDYRERLLVKVSDPFVQDFFTERFPHYSQQFSESTLRRVFLLSFAPELRFSLSSPDTLISFSQILDEGISVLYDLGGVSPQAQRFIGILISLGMEMTTLARANQPQPRRKKHILCIDEWHQFLSESPTSLERMLDLCRKYGLSLLLSSQNLHQTSGIAAALQNCMQLAWRLGYDDARRAASRFIPTQTGLPPVHPNQRPSFFAGIIDTLISETGVPPEHQHAAYWEMRLKSLDTGHCLVHYDNQTVEIAPLTVPPLLNQSLLDSLKEEYARRLLRYPPATSDVAPAQTSDAPTRPIRIHPIDARTPRQTQPQRQFQPRQTQPQPLERGKTQRKNKSNEGALPPYDDDMDDDWQPYTEM